ncbi:MAG: hypothetical protein JXA99_03245, partial [Candidatus Lokiarchaeota archaeon]|nr:hypothetical protein [Candidatus Lokiarchaeota archaeon]
TKGYWGNDTEIMYIFSSDGVTWSNATVISDGFNGVYWNSGKSNCPNIAVDYSGKIHVVWMDETIGPWSYNTKDQEIMYASSSNGVTWSNVTVISEGYNGVYWNNGGCGDPIIAIDSINKIHIVWYDFTIGSWGNDGEIMYIELVEDDSPVIIDPPHYEDGKIIWTAIDDDPNRYTLTRGESLVASGIWQSNVPVIVDIGYLDTGSYTFTVSLTDQAGYSVFDSVQFMIFFKMGDVNHDGVLNIVDSLLVAQYYVGLNPSPFYVKEADVDYNGNIDIIDALMIAQAYVGLNELPF